MPRLRDDEARLLVAAGSHPEGLTCCIRGMRLVAVSVLDDDRTVVLRGEGGAGWWICDDGTEADVSRLAKFTHTGTMPAAPDRLWRHFRDQLLVWTEQRTPLTWLAAPGLAFLHDGVTPLALPVKAYPRPSAA